MSDGLEHPRRDPDGALPGEDDEEYFLGEVTIAPPLEEFRRQYEKKVRSFDGEDSGEQLQLYAQAFELGEALIRRCLGEEERC